MSNNYSYFFSLSPKHQPYLSNTSCLCYLFILDSEGNFACQIATVQPDILSMLPQLEAKFLFSLDKESDVFDELRIFGLVRNKNEVCSSEIFIDEFCNDERFHSDKLCLLGFIDSFKQDLLSHFEELYWHDFRSLVLLCPEWQISLLARAKELGYFSLKFNFCNFCGRELKWLEEEFGKVCKNCPSLFFPRQDPSVISLICQKATDGSEKEWLLLAHNQRFKKHLYSLIAGFVDAGEALEHAVIREAWEEAGVRLENLHYLCSQAWPQVHSLMAGFFAYTNNGMAVCRPDEKEITSLLWLERQDVLRCLNYNKPDNVPFLLTECCERYFLYSSQPKETALLLPQPGSIARKLIELWAYSSSSISSILSKEALKYL